MIVIVKTSNIDHQVLNNRLIKKAYSIFERVLFSLFFQLIKLRGYMTFPSEAL